MGYKSKLVILSVLGIAVWFGLNNTTPPAWPKLEDTWWGPRKRSDEDVFIRKFQVNISDSVIEDLEHRLANHRPFQPPLEGVHHHYGLNTKLLQQVVDFWRTDYNWRRRERIFNKFPQYTVSIQGLRVHYIHVKPQDRIGVKLVPLLLLHGWPGSVREFYEIIPKLIAPQKGGKFMFEVFVPSLPGYGFSEAPTKPGMGAAQMAVFFRNFMKRMDKQQYYIQGGDWGAIIVQHMAALYPETILGVHSNMCMVHATPMSTLKLLLGSLYPPLLVSEKLQDRVYPLSKMYSNLLLETGYFHLQATKPDTVGVALNDSPVGLAAYILEKFVTWTNKEYKDREDGGLTERFSLVGLLDNVMLYWVTGSITTSMRLYAETFAKEQRALGLESIPVTVPSACAIFPNELSHQPPALWGEKYRNLVQVSEMDEGGHFAAFEVPKLLAQDIFEAVGKMIEFHETNTKTLN